MSFPGRRKPNERLTPGTKREPIRLVGAVCVLGVACLLGVTTVLGTVHARWRAPFAKAAPTYSPKVLPSVERDLRLQGVRISPAVHRLLSVLLSPWEDRPEMRKLYSDSLGRPDVLALLDWGASLPDSFSAAIVPELGSIIELRSRLGLMGSDQQILPVLYWTVDNPQRRYTDLGPIITRMADVWRERPEVREQFSDGPRVDVIGFFRWVNALPVTDKRHDEFYPQYFEIRRTILELERMKGGVGA